MPFRFRLASIERLRGLERDQCRQQLAEAYRAEELVAERVARLRGEIESLQLAAQQRLQPGPVSLDDLRESARYLVVLRAELSAATAEREAAAAIVAQATEALVEADRQAKTMERLRHRDLGRFNQEQARREAKQMDEAALRSAS